jgi:hypothetical protein
MSSGKRTSYLAKVLWNFLLIGLADKVYAQFSRDYHLTLHVSQ